MTLREVLAQFQKTCVWIAAFSALFVAMYFIMAMLVKFTLFSFVGLVPDISRNLVRLVFYGLSVAFVAGSFFYKKRQYSKAVLNPLCRDGYALIKHMLNTFIVGMALSQGPAICGLLMVFVSKLFFDFYILAAVSLGLIFTSIPKLSRLEKQLTDAL